MSTIFKSFGFCPKFLVLSNSNVCFAELIIDLWILEDVGKAFLPWPSSSLFRPQHWLELFERSIYLPSMVYRGDNKMMNENIFQSIQNFYACVYNLTLILIDWQHYSIIRIKAQRDKLIPTWWFSTSGLVIDNNYSLYTCVHVGIADILLKVIGHRGHPSKGHWASRTSF